jgi:outer membrane PBP1 activator LpoA protein
MISRPCHALSAAPALCWALLYGAAGLFATSIAHADDLPTIKLTPHIALLLPLESPTFGRYADAVKQGFLAAARVQGKTTPPIRIYATNEDTQHMLTAYQQAIDAGAELVIGPLTHDGVTAIATSNLVSMPTLALNFPEPNTPQPPLLYLFGLTIESEARQLARLAHDDGHLTAFIINDDTPLSKRMRDAFIEAFAATGGSVVAEFTYSDERADLDKLRQNFTSGAADMAFLALGAIHARAVCPYLSKTIPLYATSQITAAGSGPLIAHDLDQVTFIDMPWLLLADHPAVMVYPRMDSGDALDLERMYALGIDAFRIGLELVRQNRDLVLDGVTGSIRLNGRDQQFMRDLTAAQFVNGKVVVRSKQQ